MFLVEQYQGWSEYHRISDNLVEAAEEVIQHIEREGYTSSPSTYITEKTHYVVFQPTPVVVDSIEVLGLQEAFKVYVVENGSQKAFPTPIQVLR